MAQTIQVDDNPKHAVKQMSGAELLAELDRLRAEKQQLETENTRLKQSGSRGPGLTCKVSSKGALSVYGLGRFPVTLYRDQWGRLFEATDRIKAYMQANADSLASKSQQ